MSKYTDYDSFDEDVEENEILEKKRNEIKNFTLNDYMSCGATKSTLILNWQQNFDDNLEKKIEDIYQNHYEYMKGTMANVFYRAEQHHVVDLISLISHHLVRDYDVSIFHEDPDLAAPLLADFNRIQEERREEQRKRYSKAFTKANKVFDWTTIKKDEPTNDEDGDDEDEANIENDDNISETSKETSETSETKQTQNDYNPVQILPRAALADNKPEYKPANTYVKRENKRREYSDVSFDRFNRSNTYVPKQTSSKNFYTPKSITSKKTNKEFDWSNRKNK